MFSIEDYCASNLAAYENAPPLTPRLAAFLDALDLPRIHPFCSIQVENRTEWFAMGGSVPPMGPLETTYDAESHPNALAVLITMFWRVFPPLWAMTELWLRLFACGIGPVGVLYLVWRLRTTSESKLSTPLLLLCCATVASALVVMTDTLYVLQMSDGSDYPVVGIVLFVSSIVLSMQVAIRHDSSILSLYLVAMTLLANHLIWDHDTNSLVFGRDMPDYYSDKYSGVDDTSCRKLFPEDQKLFYHDENKHVKSIADLWEKGPRMYPMTGKTEERNHLHSPTSWTITGDSRTGLPFLLNTLKPREPQWTRVFLPTLEDDEVVVLDIATPKDETKDNGVLYLVLHGLNGGSSEDYIRDMVIRETEMGATVAVMVARGLMDLPVRSWNIFNGARTSDADAAALALRRAINKMENLPVLIGVGYSMGAIVLNNYVATSGPYCQMDAAISFSGGLDLRQQEHFLRAQRLWQPMLAETLRDVLLLGKFGRRVRDRLTATQFLKVMRGSHVTELDRHAVVAYNGFDDLDHYYRSMSALGDITPEEYEEFESADLSGKKISQISIPLCVVHALDDPLVTWRTVAANSGLLHPDNLVKTGEGNLMLLLTKAGGHVGWPVGTAYFMNNWEWMSGAAASFAKAVRNSQRRKSTKEESAISHGEQVTAASRDAAAGDEEYFEERGEEEMDEEKEERYAVEAEDFDEGADEGSESLGAAEGVEDIEDENHDDMDERDEDSSDEGTGEPGRVEDGNDEEAESVEDEAKVGEEPGIGGGVDEAATESGATAENTVDTSDHVDR